MKVLEVIGGDIPVTFLKKNYMKLNDDYTLKIVTDEGVLRYEYKKGFEWNGRSGPNFPISLLLPRWGDQSYQKCVLTHDCNFDLHFLSFELTNELFKSMLIHAKVKKWIAKIGYKFVSSKLGAYLYENDEDIVNQGRCDFYWDSK